MPGAVILGVQPFPHLLAVAVHRQRLAFEGVRDEERHELLGILVRAVRVRAARDRGADAVGAAVREHLQVAAGLGRAVRARGAQRVAFDRASTRLEVAVDLVGRDLHVTRVVGAGPLEQAHRAEHVRVDELLRPEDRPVDVGLGGEVDDCVASGRGARDGLRIGDVSLEELVLDALEVRGIPGVGQLVENCHLGALSGKPAHEVGADEPGPSGNEDAHRTRVPAVSLANDITLEKIPISRVDASRARTARDKVSKVLGQRISIGSSTRRADQARMRRARSGAVVAGDRGEALGEAVAPVGELGGALLAAQDRHRGARGAGAELRRRDPAAPGTQDQPPRRSPRRNRPRCNRRPPRRARGRRAARHRPARGSQWRGGRRRSGSRAGRRRPPPRRARLPAGASCGRSCDRSGRRARSS